MKQKLATKTSGAELFSRFGILLIFAVVVIAASLASDRFLAPDNIISVFTQCTVIGVLSCGMTMLIVSGTTDLSAGSGVALAGVVCALVINSTGSWILAVLATVATMLLTSVIQGVLVSYFAIVAFIVTLAGQLAFRGAAQVISGGAPIIGVGAIAKISSERLFGIPWLVIISILMVLITWLIMNYTSFGRYVYAIGGNREAATAAGINVKLMTLFTYLYMGVCTAFAGIMLAARTNSGQPTAGNAYEFDAIIACVLGGCGMAGGVGSAAGSLIGALTIGVINNCMNLVGVSPYYQSIVKGIIIVLAVLLDKKTHDAVMKAS